MITDMTEDILLIITFFGVIISLVLHILREDLW
jgi:hypothetical protein